MKKFLITRPEHDDTTHYLSKWAKKSIDLAAKIGIRCFDLHQQKANQKQVTSILTKQNPRLVQLNGHGSATSVTGHNKEMIIQANNNETLLNGKIVYAVSCKSAKTLGPKSISSGAAAYLGYEEDFIFFYEKDKITHAESDPVAKLFLEPSVVLMNTLLKGRTVNEAYDKSQQKFKENIQKLMTSDMAEKDRSLLTYLWWNRKNQVKLGDGSASF